MEREVKDRNETRGSIERECNFTRLLRAHQLRHMIPWKVKAKSDKIDPKNHQPSFGGNSQTPHVIRMI